LFGFCLYVVRKQDVNNTTSLYTSFYSLLIDEMWGYQQPLKLKERTPCSIRWSSTAELFTGTGITWAILGAASMANCLTSWRRVVRTDKAWYVLTIKACPVLHRAVCDVHELLRIHTYITLVWHVCLLCLSLLGDTRTYSVLISTAHHTTRDSIGLHSWYSSQYFSPLDFQCKAVPWWLSEHCRQLSHCAILCMIATYTKPEVTNQHCSFNHPLVAHGMQKLHVYLLFHISHHTQALFHHLYFLQHTAKL